MFSPVLLFTFIPLFLFSCHALETGLLTRLFGVHTHQRQTPSRAVQLPPKFEHLPRMLANQMRAVPANYEPYQRITRCTRELRAVPANYALYPRITCIALLILLLLESPDSLSTTKSSLPNYLHHTVFIVEKLLIWCT